MTTISFSPETLLMPAARPSTLTRSLGLALAFSLLIALSAQFKIPLPFTPVPATGQTFAVLLCGALLGARWGTIAVGLYLLEGFAGLPVFAGGHNYTQLSATIGYLPAFMIGAAVTGWFCERGWDKSTVRALSAMTFGLFVIYAGGWFGLTYFMPASAAFAQGVVPFVVGDIFKIVLAAAALPLGWKLTRPEPI